MHNHSDLPSRGNKYSFLFIDDESYTLIVNELSVLDAGEYTVTASNKNGEATSVLKLNTGRKYRDKASVFIIWLLRFWENVIKYRIQMKTKEQTNF